MRVLILRTVAIGTALAAPPPPPHLIAPIEAGPQPAPAAQPDEAPAKQRPRVPSRPGRNEPSKPLEPKADAAPKTDSAEPSRADEAPPDDSQQLRTQQPGDDAALERSIRDLLSRASADLGRVDYGALGVDAKAQYDTAKRFIQQSYDALKARNPVFAGNLAEKAAALAAVLLGR